MALDTFDILIPGNYFCDLVFTGIPEFPSFGTEVFTKGLKIVPGGVLNTVFALQKLEAHVGWTGAIGTDLFSRHILDLANNLNLDTSLLRHTHDSLQRVTVAISYPHDRAFLTYIDSSPSIVDLLIECRDKITFKHLHFTGLTLDHRLPDILRDIKTQGITVSMDCQHRKETLDMPLVQETLGLLDIFMPNKGEAYQLTQAKTLEEASNTLLDYVPYLVIKEGAQGAYAWHKGQYFQSEPITVDPLDTTGAGDVFNAGFLKAYLDGTDPQTCLRWGNICGGLSTLGYGGTSTAPTLTEVKKRLEMNT